MKIHIMNIKIKSYNNNNNNNHLAIIHLNSQAIVFKVNKKMFNKIISMIITYNNN